MVKRLTQAEIFRQTATDIMWQKVVEDHAKMTSDQFKKEYGFTWQSIVNAAAEKGYYTKKPRKNSFDKKEAKVAETFFVHDYSAETKVISRSVQLREDIYTRLKTFEVQKSQYTKTALLNQLLDSALKLYGF
jgi:hypothetical protein